MAIEIDVRVIGETAANVVHELMAFASRLSTGLGVAQTPPDPEPLAEAMKPPAAAEATEAAKPPAAADANGAGKPASARKRGPKPEPEAAKIDRAAIIDGLTKIYSKGDPDIRLAITKFRDGQGADRLRDLKDDALPAAADLLVELKLAESADAP